MMYGAVVQCNDTVSLLGILISGFSSKLSEGKGLVDQATNRQDKTGREGAICRVVIRELIERTLYCLLPSLLSHGLTCDFYY